MMIIQLKLMSFQKCVSGSDLLIVPDLMQMNIIKGAHKEGHYVVAKPEKKLENDFYILKVKQKIEINVENCLSCILVNQKCVKQEGLLHHIENE